MNLIAAAPAWLIWLLVAALAAAAIEDAMRLRISNVTCAAVALGAVAAMVIAGPALVLWQNALLFVLILGLGTVAFSAGWFGGGDVKLFAATGLWLDLRGGLALVTTVLLAGGVVALGYLAVGLLRRRPAGSSRDRRIPYGVAIALGSLIVIWLARRATDGA